MGKGSIVRHDFATDTKARKFITANISKLRKTRNIVAAKICWFTVIGAYCVGRVHTMLHLPWRYYDIWSLLCMLDTQYASLVVLFYWKRIV